MNNLFNAFELLLKRPTPRDVRRIQYAVTFRCDARCTMCKIWEKAEKRAEEELSLDQIRSAFANRSFLKRLAIVDLTGGEPFVRKDFDRICTFFLETFPSARLLITTNGLNTDRIIETTQKVIDAQGGERVELSISMDGREETHDKIRGRKGAFQAAVRTANRAREIGTGKVTFSFTLIPENADQVMDAYRFAKDRGFAFTTVRYAQESFYYANEGFLDTWTPEKKAIANASIAELIAARKREGFTLQGARDIHFLRRQMTFDPKKQRKESCYSGIHSFYLDPYGTLYPCVMLERPLGNIVNEGIEKVWFSDAADKVREYIKRKNCSCLTECETFLSMQRDPAEIFRVFGEALKER